jgi:hypothetical protein
MPSPYPLLAALLALATFAGAAPHPDVGVVVFRDDFNGKLADGWFWEREERANWRVGPAGLEVCVQPGNMWGGANNARNVLYRPLPDPAAGPVEISVTLSNVPSAQWEQANLVWFYDDSNMVKLNMELVTGRFTIVMGREENDRARTVAIVPLDDYAVDLRLQAVGSRVRGQFRTRHWQQWRDVGECDLPVKGPPKASLHFYNGPPAAVHWVSVRNFAIRQMPPEGAWRPRVRATEQTLRLPGNGTGPAIALEHGFVLGCGAPAFAKGEGEQRIYRHQDGSGGWSWDRRATASPQPLRMGVGLGKLPGGEPSAAFDFGGEPPGLELDAVTRLENDHGDHTLAAHLWLSASPAGDGPLTRISVLFDWYGPEATGRSLNDGQRDYEYVETRETTEGPAQYQYRIKGLRGAPPRVAFDAFLKDARRRGLSANTKVVGLWFGNEIWDGSRGGTLVTKLDLVINGRRISGLTTK